MRPPVTSQKRGSSDAIVVLPGAARTDQRDDLTGADLERHVAQNSGKLGAVAEPHVSEHDVAAHGARQRRRLHRIGDRGLRLEQLEHASRGADRFLIAAEERSQRADGAGDVDRVQQERDERAGGEHCRRGRARRPARAPPRRRRSATKPTMPKNVRADPRAPDRRGDHVMRGATRSVAYSSASRREALHGADLRERLVRRPHRFGDPVLHAGAGASQARVRRRTPRRRRAGRPPASSR